MKRMTKSRGDNLRKGGTQCAGRICGPVRLYSQFAVAGTGDVAEFVNHSTLLRHHQEQQKAEALKQLSHSDWYRPSLNRTWLRYQNTLEFAVSVADGRQCNPISQGSTSRMARLCVLPATACA